MTITFGSRVVFTSNIKVGSVELSPQTTGKVVGMGFLQDGTPVALVSVDSATEGLERVCVAVSRLSTNTVFL